MTSSETQISPSGVDAAPLYFDDRHWQKRLRIFSGKVSVPNGKLDYDSWVFHVGQLTPDSNVFEAIQRRVILQSLAQPALSLVRSLGDASTVTQILSVLHACYGSSLDGPSLLIEFYDSIQQSNKSAVTYLQRLQWLLRRVVDSGEVLIEHEYRDLLKQFCRGSHDVALIVSLGLELNANQYDDFCELLSALHSKEAKRREKINSLNRAEAAIERPKIKVASRLVNVDNSYSYRAGYCASVGGTNAGHYEWYTYHGSELPGESSQGRAPSSVSVLTAAPITAPSSGGSGQTPQPTPSSRAFRPLQSRGNPPPRSGFCYQCGVLGHYF